MVFFYICCYDLAKQINNKFVKKNWQKILASSIPTLYSYSYTWYQPGDKSRNIVWRIMILIVTLSKPSVITDGRTASTAAYYTVWSCRQMNEESTLKPTPEFFSMILYNSDPQSKVSCALTFFVEKSIMRLADIRAAIRFFLTRLKLASKEYRGRGWENFWRWKSQIMWV